MRRKKIGVMDFHGSVDITDPCYDKDVWCRMNDVKISDGEYTCNVWHHTDKGNIRTDAVFVYTGRRDLGSTETVTSRVRKTWRRSAASAWMPGWQASSTTNRITATRHGANSVTGSVMAMRG